MLRAVGGGRSYVFRTTVYLCALCTVTLSPGNFLLHRHMLVSGLLVVPFVSSILSSYLLQNGRTFRNKSVSLKPNNKYC